MVNPPPHRLSSLQKSHGAVKEAGQDTQVFLSAPFGGGAGGLKHDMPLLQTGSALLGLCSSGRTGGDIICRWRLSAASSSEWNGHPAACVLWSVVTASETHSECLSNAMSFFYLEVRVSESVLQFIDL